ncbi:MAG: O-antigen ligase family protein [Candidatus Paceibacterota bacterium]
MNDILKGVVYICIFAVPFVVLLVTGSMFFPYITGKNFAFRILVEVMTVAWVVLALLDSRYRPRFSWAVISVLSLLGIMFVANMFGEYPFKSFWSNYERMEGYVTLVHFFLYFMVTATMLTVEKHWNWFFNTTLAIATLVCFYAFAQLSGAADISQSSWRVDSTLGNSTYMAVYMLFHIFIAALMFVRTRSTNLRFLYIGLIALFVFILFQTGTRGAILGLTGGGLITALYLTIFATDYPQMRKVGAGVLTVLVLIVSGFVALRHTEFVQGIPMLDRIADITLSEGDIRFMVWEMALEGVRERPMLGWGQENFSYVFNEYYNPGLHGAEAWYDRAHNIVLNWWVVGGTLGLLAYLSLFATAVWYVAIRPIIARIRHERSGGESFSVAEQALLLGLLAAYFFHNLFVFDNIVSYIFFAVILAFIHQRVATDIPWMQRFAIDREVVARIVAPTALVGLVAIVYVVNVPSMRAAADIIDAFKAQTYETRFGEFESALARGGFGRQEIVEQMSDRLMGLYENSDIPKDERDEYAKQTEEALLAMIEEKPGDPRFHIFLAGLYRAQGKYDGAAAALAGAREYTPTKPAVIVEQGIIELQRGNFDAMAEHFATSYELAPDYDRGRLLYAGSLLRTGESARIAEVLHEEDLIPFMENILIFVSFSGENALNDVEAALTMYREEHPESVPAYTAYAMYLIIVEQSDAAVAVLREGATRVPPFAPVAECFIENIESGTPMQAGCL